MFLFTVISQLKSHNFGFEVVAQSWSVHYTCVKFLFCKLTYLLLHHYVNKSDWMVSSNTEKSRHDAIVLFIDDIALPLFFIVIKFEVKTQ